MMRKAIPLTAGLALAASALLAFLPGQQRASPPRANVHLVDLHAIALNQGPELPIEGSPARVDLAANRLTFSERVVHLWVQFDPPGAPVPSFVIQGLIFPDIELHVGTRLEVTFLVESLRSSADFVIVNHPPPFPDYPLLPDPYNLSFRQHIPGYFAPSTRPPARFRANGFTVYGARLDYDVRTTGVAWYCNNFIGAANMGEYGRIIVVP